MTAAELRVALTDVPDEMEVWIVYEMFAFQPALDAGANGDTGDRYAGKFVLECE